MMGSPARSTPYMLPDCPVSRSKTGAATACAPAVSLEVHRECSTFRRRILGGVSPGRRAGGQRDGPDRRRHRHPLQEVRPRERPDAASCTRTTRRRSSPSTSGTTSARKNEKPGQDRLRAPVRAPDVQRQRELQRRLLQGARAGRRDRPERHHQRGPHQLLPERADHRARHRALDGVRPHGPPARRHQPGQARRAARRGAEREAPGREPALRPGRRADDRREHLSRRATRTPGPSSARWRTSTPPRSRT